MNACVLLLLCLPASNCLGHELFVVPNVDMDGYISTQVTHNWDQSNSICSKHNSSLVPFALKGITNFTKCVSAYLQTFARNQSLQAWFDIQNDTSQLVGFFRIHHNKPHKDDFVLTTLKSSTHNRWLTLCFKGEFPCNMSQHICIIFPVSFYHCYLTWHLRKDILWS